MAKITHIFKTFYPDEPDGGIQEVIHQLGLLAIAEGHTVEVISLSKNPSESYYDGIKCISYKKNIGLSSMPISWSLLKNFRQIVENTDIIHLHYPYPYTELLTLFNNFSKPIVITFHAPIIGRKLLMAGYKPFAKALFNKADVIVPTSPNLAMTESLLDDFRHKLKPIGLWISDKRFNNDAVEPEFEQTVAGFGEFALFVGVLRVYKGLHVLLDAAKKVKKNILISGRGPLYNELKERIEKEKITNVHLLGFQKNSHVSFLLKKCSYVVLPSITRGECFGVVLLEASHYSKAMISTELGTGTSWVNTNDTGFIIEPNNSEVLAEKMNYLFANPIVCKNLGINANIRLKEMFSTEVCGRAYMEIYNSLINRESPKNKK